MGQILGDIKLAAHKRIYPLFHGYLLRFDGSFLRGFSLIDTVRRELAAGRKETHWIWYIFPQLASLGYSPMARKYGIASPAEARRYWEHAVLGPRLRECSQILLALPGHNISSILGNPDGLKFRSCLTLFAAIAPEEPIFEAALEKFFDGERDPLTIGLLHQMAQ